jgi:outer membrane protein
MNRTLKFALSSIAFGAVALGLLAQEPPLKIVTVDMGKLLEGHYKTEEQMTKLRADEQKAQEQLEQMVKDRNKLVDQYKETQDQSKNTLLTADARSKAESDGQKLMEEIQKSQADLQNFSASTQRSLQQRLNNFRSLLLDEISKKVTEVAKRKGATMVVDTSGPSALGIAPVIYADPAFDITNEVLTEINKDRPPPTTPAPAAGTPAPATTDATSVTVPGIAPKN